MSRCFPATQLIIYQRIFDVNLWVVDVTMYHSPTVFPLAITLLRKKHSVLVDHPHDQKKTTQASLWRRWRCSTKNRLSATKKTTKKTTKYFRGKKCQWSKVENVLEDEANTENRRPWGFHQNQRLMRGSYPTVSPSGHR